METGQNSLLSRPDSCPVNGDHLSPDRAKPHHLLLECTKSGWGWRNSKEMRS